LDAGEVGAVEFLRGSCYGNLFRQGIHLLDAMRWVSGGREVLWVMSQWSDDPSFLGRHARGDRGYWDDTTHPGPMWMVHHLAFEGGLRASLETGLLYQRSRTFTDDWLQKRLTVIGSEGLAECQTAAHCKFLSTRRAGWTVVESGLDHYAAATRRFHAELRDALTTGIPHRNDAKDAFKTFEVALACAQSAADGALVALPLPRDRDPVSELESRRRQARAGISTRPSAASISLPGHPDPTAARPEVSVIVALPDHRGLASECVESLTRQQTYSRDQYEVIVVSDGTDPALDLRVKALLGEQDRMITHASTNLYLLYNVGVREARGRLLFFTESHCLAEPECLEELVTFFATHDYDAASCRIVAIYRNVIARMQARLFDAGFRIWSRPGDWRKVNIIGFGIYRDLYFHAGGYETDLERFADLALGAKLHSQGRRLGYAAGATVRHCYLSGFRELFAFNREVTRGECAYRARAPEEHCERYFGYAEEWTQRESFRPSLARALCQASWRSLWRNVQEGGVWSMVAAQAKAMLRLLPVALLGPRGRLLSYRWSLWMAMARCRLWCFNEEKSYRAYCDAYDLMIRYSRLEFIAEHLAATPPAPPDLPVYRVGELSEEWLVGFHPVERWEGEAFRWSGPVALLRLGLPKGTYEVRVESEGLRQAPVPLCLGVFFNRHQVPRSSLRWRDGTLTFRLDPATFTEGPEQHLLLTSNPLRPWTVGVPDRRELGLPIFSIAFTPIEEAMSEATNHHRQLSVR